MFCVCVTLRKLEEFMSIESLVYENKLDTIQLVTLEL